MSKFAVGYSMKKKMAKGGSATGKEHRENEKGVHLSAESMPIRGKETNRLNKELQGSSEASLSGESNVRHHKEKLSELRAMPKPNIKGLAEGGEVDHEADMVHRILKKCYSEGGKVANGGDDDLSGMADGDPNNFDDLALRDDLDFHYTGENSGDEAGNAESAHGGEDMVKRIMKKHKQSNPRPA